MTIKKLKDVLPREALGPEFEGDPFRDLLDETVIESIDEYDPRFPFKHKNIFVWWILENGKAVGWNENPSRGWSFPVANVNKD